MSSREIIADDMVADLSANQDAHPVLMNMLEAIENDPTVSQRRLAEQLGVALGLVNSYLRWSINKGWIKMQKIPSRRYAYYITPQGLIEKSTMIGKHMQQSFALFRSAREECQQIIEEFENRSIQKVVLVGSGDLRDFVMMMGHAAGHQFETVQTIADIQDFDALLLTEMLNSQNTYNKLKELYPEDKIFVMPLLKVRRGNII